MSPKIFVLVATLCVVNASVVNINVFDDDSDNVVPQSVSNCYYRECEQRCRRLGFPGGACVNGRCKCDNFLNTQDSVEGGITDESDNVIPQSLSNCYYRECEQRCRRLGFPSGACVNGRCKCDNFLNTVFSAEEANILELLASGSCYRRECIYRCRQQGYNRGICINGRCQCNNYETAETAEDSSSVSPKTSVETAGNEIDPSLEMTKADILTAARACDAGQCNSICHRIGYAGGWCRGGQCRCY